MYRGIPILSLVFVAMTASLAIADPAGTKLIVPVVQLTVQPPRFLLTRENCVGNVLLRELQRQAVLIAARDELGLGTRDMVLREPFATHGANHATTVLIESRIWRGEQAQICLSRFDGKQPANPYALAELQVDQAQNACPQWINSKISNDPLVDYPEFVSKCEEASRTTYLTALKNEKVLGDFSPRAVRWVDGAADAKALLNLEHLDVFSQYLALRQLHGQIAIAGASTDRMAALVRAYANLGQLTCGQWSQAHKVFYARALLYAERLVVHDNSSAASLFIRAYARAFTGLHAAALKDIELARSKSPGGAQPSWTQMIEGLCRYDSNELQQAIHFGSWHDRQAAVFLSVVVDQDEFTRNIGQDRLTQAINSYPGMFVLAPLCSATGDTAHPRPADQVVNVLPVVLRNVLGNASLPSSVLYAVHHVTPGDDSLRQVAQVRDRLIANTVRAPLETAEPSLGVLADLIEQQEFLAVMNKAVSLRNAGTGGAELSKLLAGAVPIQRMHPWGPCLDALSLNGNAAAGAMESVLDKIGDHDPGDWVGDAVSDLNGGGDSRIVQASQKQAILTADSIVDDYTAAVCGAKAVHHNAEQYLRLLRETSPHSATLMEAWLRAMPVDRLVRNEPLYEQAMVSVEGEFFDRPPVLTAASDWSDSVGEFDRTLKLLRRIDFLQPTVGACEHAAKVTWHLGHHEQAIAYLMRAVALCLDANADASELYQRAAVYLIEDHRFDDAFSCIQLSGQTPTPRVWQLLARCYEAMGRLELADDCLQRLSANDPAALVRYYLWAKRLGRSNAGEIHRRAVAALAVKSVAPGQPEFLLEMADGQDVKAMQLLSKQPASDVFDAAQLLILATQHNDGPTIKLAMLRLGITQAPKPGFGVAMKALADAKEAASGTNAFTTWVGSQLEDEDQLDCFSLGGRYLVAAGHPTEGRQLLQRVMQLGGHENENYFLAWKELQSLPPPQEH